eukprot:Amastigsp_a339564_1667.p2 type:complete len:178 gc:universal Amastigsp_a339564_1667:1283-750(-)
MGGVFSKRKAEVLVLGLDNSGKSTIIAHLQRADTDEVTPTVGYATKKVIANKINYTMHDMSGQDKYRNLWATHFATTDGIVFVMDATDAVRIPIVRDELEQILKHEAILARPSMPLLFFANKFDVPGHMRMDELSAQLDLQTLLGDRVWHIAESVAITGEGLDLGMAWMADQLRGKK